jgi:hypothetical protein
MNNKFVFAGLLAVAVILVAVSVTLAAGPSYKNWRGMMGTKSNQVTEANFDKYTQMHKLMAEGDYLGAQKIKAELGLGQGAGAGRGCGMRQARDGKATCPMANGQGTGFVDKNNNGICDNHENLK